MATELRRFFLFMLVAVSASTIFSGCAGGLAQLQQIQQGVDGAKAAGAGWESARAAAAEADRAKAELATLQAERQALQDEITAQQQAIEALQGDAKLAAEQRLLAEKEKLLSMEKRIAELETQVQAAAAQRLSPPGVSLSHTAKSVATFSPAKVEPLSIPAGKTALVAFQYNRQVPAENMRDSASARVEPGLLNRDTSAWWAPYRAPLARLWSDFGPKAQSLVPELLDIAEMQKNPEYSKQGTFVPKKILGITQPFDYYMPEGFGYFNPMVASKLAATATALNADNLLILEYSATSGIFDGSKESQGQLHLRLQVSLIDKSGKLVAERTLEAMSDSKAAICEDEMYPDAIEPLAAEANAKILAQLESMLKGE